AYPNRNGQGKPRRLALDLMVLALGTITLPVVFLLNAIREGTLSRMIYYCVTYNRVVHMQPLGEKTSRLFVLEHISEYPLFFTSTAIAIGTLLTVWYARLAKAIAIRDLWAAVEFGIPEYLLLHFLCALMPVLLLPQFFIHYFLPAIPFLALVVAWS